MCATSLQFMLRDLFYTIKQEDGPSVELPGLMLAMWQMEQLQERHLPRIHAHFNGLDMKMDTSLWFLVSVVRASFHRHR